MRKIFVHVGAHGKPIVGGGGKVVLTNIANEIGKMGYETYAFVSKAKLTWNFFKWLSHDKLYFKLATKEDFLNLDQDDYRIVSGWLLSLGIPDHIKRKNVRYWCGAEVFRTTNVSSKKYVLNNYEKIAVVNSYFEPWYRKIGFKGEIIPITNWINKLFYWNGEHKIRNSIGWQIDMSNRKRKIGEDLARANFGRDVDIIPCHGDHKEAADKMRGADFFLFWGHHCSFIDLFKGEVFGLPMYEAMASGCVVVARRHEGNKYMKDIIPLVDTPSEAVNVLRNLMRNPKEKEKIRKRSLICIKEQYRFDEERRKNIRIFLD